MAFPRDYTQFSCEGGVSEGSLFESRMENEAGRINNDQMMHP